MSKGNDKKPKSDKSKPKTGISPYKAAQSTAPRSACSRERQGVSLDFSNISVHRGRESEKDIVLQQFL
jgi:hypothetical protein